MCPGSTPQAGNHARGPGPPVGRFETEIYPIETGERNPRLETEIAGVLAGSSANSNGVSTLDTPFADPDAESLRNKVNELIAALRRP